MRSWRWALLASLAMLTVLTFVVPFHMTYVTNNGNGSGDTTEVPGFAWGESETGEFDGAGIEKVMPGNVLENLGGVI